MNEGAVTNAADVVARRERVKLLERAVGCYRTYLWSRIGGMHTAASHARRQWTSAEHSLFVGLGSHSEAAPGEIHPPGAAEEAKTQASRGELLERFEELHATCDEQLSLMRAAVDRNTRLLTEIVETAKSLGGVRGARRRGPGRRRGGAVCAAGDAPTDE